MKKFWLGFVIVAVAGLVVYWPSFWHLFRGETYIYFLNTQGYDSFASLVSHFYNYEKVRIFEPGDTLLFRPFLFTIIGGEKAFFGANYTLWHIFAVILHLVATFCLFRLLWKWRQGWLAIIVSVLFATSYMIINTVLYEQVVPYMAFTALTLTSLYYLDEHSIVSWVCMAVGAFIYELAIPFVVLFAIYYWYKRQRKWSLAMLSVVPLYLAFYLPQKLINPPTMLGNDASGIFTLQGIIAGLSSAFVLAETWFTEVVFPSVFTLKPIPQLIYYSAQIASVAWGIFLVLNVIALFVLLDPVMNYFKRIANGQKLNAFIVLLIVMVVIVILSVSLFRSGSRGTNYAVNHSFGSYVVLALALVLGFALIKDKVFSTRQYALTAIALLVFIGLSAPKTFNLNYQVMLQDRWPQYMGIKTWRGLPSDPIYYYTSIPKIMESVK